MRAITSQANANLFPGGGCGRSATPTFPHKPTQPTDARRRVARADTMNASASMSVDPLSMKSVLDRVEMLEKSYQEERLAVSFPTLRRCRPGALRSPASPPAPACVRACSE